MPPKRNKHNAKQPSAKAAQASASEDGTCAEPRRRPQPRLILEGPALPAFAPKAKRKGKKPSTKAKTPTVSSSSDASVVELGSGEAGAPKRRHGKRAKREALEAELNEDTVVSTTSNE